VTAKRNAIAKIGKHVLTFGGDDAQPQGTRPDQLLTVQDAARVLQISVSSLNKWRVAGTGPRFCRVGARVRYRPSDLAAYIAESMRESTSAP
jgi:predicted DNA-binding transcriptional regulator AlpA